MNAYNHPSTHITFLTPQEAAELLRVPVGWVYQRTRTRSIPVRKIGGHCRIPRQELLDWIDREGGEPK